VDEGELVFLTINSELPMSSHPMARRMEQERFSSEIFESVELMQGETRWREFWGKLEE
jgi:hypothetical protein